MSQNFPFGGAFDSSIHAHTNSSNSSSNSNSNSMSMAINVNNMDNVAEPSPFENALSEMKAAEWNDELALKHLPALSATLSSHFQWMNFLTLNQPSDTNMPPPLPTSTTYHQLSMQPSSHETSANLNLNAPQIHEPPVQHKQPQQHGYPLAQAANLQELLQLMNPTIEDESCITPVEQGRPIIAQHHSPSSSSQHAHEEVEESGDADPPVKSRRLSLKSRYFPPHTSSSSSATSLMSEQLSPASCSSSSSEAYSKNRVGAREARKRKRSRVHELETTIQSLQKELKELRQLAEKQQQQKQQPHTGEIVANNSIGGGMPMHQTAPPAFLSVSASSASSPITSASSSPAPHPANTANSSSSSSSASMYDSTTSAISVAGMCPPSAGDCHVYEDRMKSLLHSYIFAAFEEAKQAEKYDVSAVIKKYHHDPEKAFQALVELQAEMKKRKIQVAPNGASATPAPSKSHMLMDEFVNAYRQWLAGGSAHFSSLAHHVHPALPLHFLHWLSNHTDSFYADRSSLWHALFCDELAFSPQQMKELTTLRQTWKRNSKATVEVEKCFGRLKELMEKQKKMELEEFQQIRNIFSPLQMAKFLNWAGHFAAICIRL